MLVPNCGKSLQGQADVIPLAVTPILFNSRKMINRKSLRIATSLLISAISMHTAWANTLPGASAFIEVPRTCDAFMVKYTPHEEKDADGDLLTYIFTFYNASFSFTITDTEHTGDFRVPANLLPPHTSLTVTGKTSDGIDSVDFTNSVTIYTNNALPPEFTIEDVVKSGTGYLIRYSPHVDTDNDMDPVSYHFTITGPGGFSKTFNDVSHTGAYLIPEGQLPAHTAFTVKGKSYDGFDYSFALNSKEFSTPNSLPVIPQILSPREGERVVAVSEMIRISFKTEAVDQDSDPVTSTLNVNGPGLDTTLHLSMQPDYILLPRRSFASSQTYTATISSDDGIEMVDGTPVRFISPNTSAIDEDKISGSWSVYPNPTSGKININFDDIASPPAEAGILDNEGRLVSLIPLVQNSGITSLSADLTGLAQGVYYIRIVLPGKAGCSVKKLVVTL
jgi:hypothetical protein